MPGRQVVIVGEVYDPTLSAGWPPVAMPPIYLPPGSGGGEKPPGIWGGLPWPTPPIYYPPANPPGIWGGAPIPWPTPPIYYPPPAPAHPIVIPIPPGEKPPDPGNGLSPEHPIVIPPPAGPSGGDKVLVYAYIPGHGGCWFLVEAPAQPPVAGPKPGEPAAPSPSKR